MSKHKTRPARSGQEADENESHRIAGYEARLAEVAELAARVRHEVNNPLTGLLGQSQLLLRENLNDSARRRVETIEQLAGRIRDTVAQLRALESHDKPTPADAAPAETEKDENSPPRH